MTKTVPAGRPLRLAFLGCGYATRIHSKNLKSLPLAVERFYASRDEQKSQEYQQKYGGSGHFSSYQAAIADPQIDAVLVATPPASHLQLCLEALDSGKHVIVEKPPFLSVADFDRAAAAAHHNGCQLMVAENYFYKPLAVALRRILQEGLIGEPLFVHLNALKKQKTGNWRDDPGLSGEGALLEGGIHWINLLANLGPEVASVQGYLPGRERRMEKSIMVAFQYAGGAAGSLFYSWETPGLLQGLRISRIFGREGSVTFESNGVFLLARGRRWRFCGPRFSDISGYKAMLKDFVNALHSGSSPAFTLKMARRDLQLIESVYRSARKLLDGGDHS